MLPGALMCARLREAHVTRCVNQHEAQTSNIILEIIRANKARQEVCGGWEKEDA